MTPCQLGGVPCLDAAEMSFEARVAFPVNPTVDYWGLTASTLSVIALHEAQNITVRIFEPSGLKAFRDIEIALLLKARQVIMLEGNSLLLQFANLLLGIVNLEGERCSLVGAGKLGTIDVDFRVAAFHPQHPIPTPVLG